MAAYAASVTSPLRKAIKLGEDTVMYRGTVDVTNYNTTLAEITAITGKFRDGNPTVIMDGISSNGFLVRWDTSSKAVKAYYPTAAAAAHDHDFVVQSSGAIGTNMEIGLSADADTATLEGGTGITAARTLSDNSPIASDGAVTAAAGTEVATDVDVGEVGFIAIGLR